MRQMRFALRTLRGAKMQKPLLLHRLMKALGVSRSTLLGWRDRGLLQVGRDGRCLAFDRAEINRFLAAHTRNPSEKPFTIEALIADEDRLVNALQAAAMLGISHVTFFHDQRAGAIPHFQIDQTVRYRQSDIEQRRAERDKRKQGFNRPNLERILCMSDYVVRNLVRSGTLVVHNVDAAGHYRVDNASLHALLAELLPPWVRPKDWVADRLADPKPAISPKKVARSWTYVSARLEALELPYIRMATGHYKLPAQTVAAVLAGDIPPLTAEEIAYLFGVSQKKAGTWIDDGALICDNHRKHPETCLRPPCLRRYLRAHGGNWEWYARRMRDRERYIDLNTLGEMLPTGRGRVVYDMARGRISGLQLPTGDLAEWRFLHHDASRYTTLVLRTAARRSRGGP